RGRGGGGDGREGLRGGEPTVVECAAGNGAREFARPRFQQGFHIIDRREAARGDHRDRDALRERDGGVEIEALEQAVAGNVRVDDGGDTSVGETSRHFVGREFGPLRPALSPTPPLPPVPPTPAHPPL